MTHVYEGLTFYYMYLFLSMMYKQTFCILFCCNFLLVLLKSHLFISLVLLPIWNMILPRWNFRGNFWHDKQQFALTKSSDPASCFLNLFFKQYAVTSVTPNMTTNMVTEDATAITVVSWLETLVSHLSPTYHQSFVTLHLDGENAESVIYVSSAGNKCRSFYLCRLVIICD